MQSGAEFITSMSSLAFNELIANLQFTDLVALARTNRELYERLTGGSQPPNTPEEHAIHKSGRAYAWQGLLDNLGDAFGVHTNPNNCRHPNPALRKKVASSMRQYINNDETNSVFLLRNELDQITAQFYDADVRPNSGNNSARYSASRYLNWRRTVVLFQLLSKLEKTAHQNTHVGIMRDLDKKTLLLGERLISVWGVLTISDTSDGPTRMFTITDFVNIPKPLHQSKLAQRQLILLKKDEHHRQIGNPTFGCFFEDSENIVMITKRGIVYVEPSGTGDEIRIEKVVPPNMFLEVMYINQNTQDTNDVDIVFPLYFVGEAQGCGFWTPGKSVQLIIGSNSTLPPSNRSELAAWYKREAIVKTHLIDFDRFQFTTTPNPYVAVFRLTSSEDKLKTSLAYLSVGNTGSQMQQLFRRQELFIKDTNSRGPAVTLSNLPDAPFEYDQMDVSFKFTPIEKNHTFWYLQLRVFRSYKNTAHRYGFWVTNIVVDAAKFVHDELQQRLSFVVGNKSYVSGQDDAYHMFENDPIMPFHKGLLYVVGQGYNDDSHYMVIDLEKATIVESLFYRNGNDTSSQNLVVAVDDYTLPDNDANRQRRVQ